MSEFWPFAWILIPLAGILAGAFKEWLQFKQTQNQLGTSTEKLEKKVDVLEKALENSEAQSALLVERIQNLETIVTSQEWDTLDGHLLKSTSEASKDTENKSPLLAGQIDPPEDESASMNKAARLARRLGT
ncbi:MAG: hypothetical protein KTR29_20750 [Rhodothermaceae bacterium]|nr:hypothetical protein [Rhodothermaceae bacterium]